MSATTLSSVADIVGCLAERVDQLVEDLLPAGHREGHEWRCGSVAGEPGDSLGVHLTGTKAGIWADFASGQAGDALDLVKATLSLGIADAITWSRRWLGIENGDAAVPTRPASSTSTAEPAPDPNRWRRPWSSARPIAGTLGAIYLGTRGLRFDDPAGDVLRFAARRTRKAPDGDQIEHHPALLALLRDVRSGEATGIINIYLRSDGYDRLRDSKAKTIWGTAGGAAVMLSAFDEPTLGLTICEGPETGIALRMDNLAPVWCCGGAGNVAHFPVLDGIEALTVAADTGRAGQDAAEAVAARWRAAGREATIVTPRSNGDWADPRRAPLE